MDQLCTIYRSLILVKFMSMFVCNTTGVKVNNFLLPFTIITDHPSVNPTAKELLR